MSKSKCEKHLRVGALLEAEMLKKYMQLWHEANFEVKMVKYTTCPDQFRTFNQAQWILHLAKSEHNVKGFCSSFQNDGRLGA